jgi:hypothetical protein
MHAEDRVTASAERIAKNDATFREANERINAVAASFEHDELELLPFLCECADVECTEVVKLLAPEYEAVRADPTHFVNADGHVVNGQGWARVVEVHDRYTVVEKIGEAAEIAAELDPREND